MSSLDRTDNLDWHVDTELQIKTVKKFVELHYTEGEFSALLHHLFQSGQKGKWENVVEIIRLIGYPDNQIYIELLFELLQDINWPGSPNALIVLTHLEETELIINTEKYLERAMEKNDVVWITWIKKLVEDAHIHYKLSKEIQEILTHAEE